MIPVVGEHFPILAAHRGGGDEAPENTLKAFEYSRSLGVKHMETDVYLTVDEQVVMHHDPQVMVNGASIPINALSYDDLRRLSPDAPVPLLSEALETFPDLWWNIDAKVPEVVDPMLDVLRDHDAFGRVLLASFSEARLRYIRSHPIPELTTSLGTAAVTRLVLATNLVSNPADWRVPGPRQSVRAVQVPVTMRGIRIVTPRFIAVCHRYGLAVHVWTVNDAADMV